MNLSRLYGRRSGHAEKTVPQADRRVESRPRPSDRRGAPRQIPAERRAWLGWWEGTGFVSIEACLQDISRSGARLLVEQRPSDTQEVWFCLYDGENTVGIACEVVGNGVGVAGLCVVRIAFRQPCPDRLYRLALKDSSPGSDIEVLPFPATVVLLGAHDRAEV